jgi:hypothetical protein
MGLTVDLVRMRKEAVVDYVKALTQNVSGKTAKKLQ